MLLLNSKTVDCDKYAPCVIMSMAVSSTGTVAFCKLKRADDCNPHAVHILENGKLRTVIPFGRYIIGGLSFVHVAGKEQLVVSHGHDVILIDPGVNTSGVKRHLATVRLDLDTPLCKSGQNKVLYMQPGMKVCELELTSDSCNDTQIGQLTLGWEQLPWDMCTTDGLLVVHSNGRDDIHVVGTSLADWQVKWKTPVRDANGLCPGPRGSVFVCCRELQAIKQLSVRNGAVIRRLFFAPDIMHPSCISYRNSILTVAHMDGRKYETKQPPAWNISKYELTLSG